MPEHTHYNLELKIGMNYGCNVVFPKISKFLQTKLASVAHQAEREFLKHGVTRKEVKSWRFRLRARRAVTITEDKRDLYTIPPTPQKKRNIIN